MSNPNLLSSHLARRAPALLIVLGTLLFIAIAADVTHNGKLLQADRLIAPCLYNHAQPSLILLASAISGLGDPRIVAPFAAIVGILLARKRRWRILAIWVLAFAGELLLCNLLKLAFHIPRPEQYNSVNFGDNPGYTFPSGHTMGAAVAAGAGGLLLMHLKPQKPLTRWLLIATAATIATLVAAALLYLGVHYLTDVLAGLAVSAAWLGALALLMPAKSIESAADRHNSM